MNDYSISLYMIIYYCNIENKLKVEKKMPSGDRSGPRGLGPRTVEV